MGFSFTQSLETSRALHERLAAAPADEKRAALEQASIHTDFATFGMFKRAWAESVGPAMAAAARSPIGKGLQWGAGLAVPALGAGHLLARDARQQGEKLVDHTRNQALLTALGVGGMQGISKGIGKALSGDSPPAAAAEEPPALSVQEPQSHEQSMARPGLGAAELAALRGYPGLEALREQRNVALPQDLQELEGLGGFGRREGRRWLEEPEAYKTSSDKALQKLAAVVLLDGVLEQQVTKLAGAEQADVIECLFLNRVEGASLLRELF